MINALEAWTDLGRVLILRTIAYIALMLVQEDKREELRQLLLGYVQVAMLQSAQLMLCNARHS